MVMANRPRRSKLANIVRRRERTKRTLPLRGIGFLGVVLVVGACVATTPGPTAQLLEGEASDSLYDRIVTKIEDSGLPLPPNSGPGANDRLLPGDVVQVGYFIVPGEMRGEYRIGSGDLLAVQVADHPDLSIDAVAVAPDGQVSLNLLGPVRASGETVDALASRIAFLYSLENIRRPRATVSVVESRSGPKQLLDQLLRTGGNVTVTVLDDMRIQLPLIESVDVDRPLGEVRKEIRSGYARRFGSQLEVVVNVSERAPRSVYVLGEVREANAIDLGPRMTPLMAVATAGGLTKEADPKRVVLIRFDRQGDYQYWVLDIKEGLTDLAYAGNYVQLLPNDIVFVPQSAIDEINVFIEKFVKKDLPVPLQAQLGLRERGRSFSPRGTTVLAIPEP